ncbi:MAG: hypothetical protein SF182_07015 [Deltaproteobacteria bacterium]|nr:hypothetical protein [Deltaproteobacteria bacterium]
MEVAVELGVASGSNTVCVGVAERVKVGDGDGGAVAVCVTDAVLVAVAVGVATASGAAQKPLCRTNPLPLCVSAAACPMVPPKRYPPPPLNVAPPPAIALCERSYPPPLCASATAGRQTSASRTVRIGIGLRNYRAHAVIDGDRIAGMPSSTE